MPTRRVLFDIRSMIGRRCLDGLILVVVLFMSLNSQPGEVRRPTSTCGPGSAWSWSPRRPRGRWARCADVSWCLSTRPTTNDLARSMHRPAPGRLRWAAAARTSGAGRSSVLCCSRSWSGVVVLAGRSSPGRGRCRWTRPGRVRVLLVPGYGGGGRLDPLAAALRPRAAGRPVVSAAGDGTGDLRAQAARLGAAGRGARCDRPAPRRSTSSATPRAASWPGCGCATSGGARCRAPGADDRLAAARHRRGRARRRARRRLPDRVRAAGAGQRPAAPAQRRRRDSGRARVGHRALRRRPGRDPDRLGGAGRRAQRPGAGALPAARRTAHGDLPGDPVVLAALRADARCCRARPTGVPLQRRQPV